MYLLLRISYLYFFINTTAAAVEAAVELLPKLLQKKRKKKRRKLRWEAVAIYLEAMAVAAVVVIIKKNTHTHKINNKTTDPKEKKITILIDNSVCNNIYYPTTTMYVDSTFLGGIST
jgi:DNA topoisomerase VI subunit B